MKKGILFFLAFVAMNAIAQIPTAGLVGHYNFDNGALTDNINGIDFNKTGTASTNIADRFGNPNEAISLNGDDLIRSDIDFNMGSSNPYLAKTISFWVKTATNDANSRLIYNDNNRTNVGATTFNGLIVYLQNGQINATNRVGSNGNLITHSVAVSDNNWHHVTVQAYSTNTSGTVRFFTYVFIDGAKEGGSIYQPPGGSVTGVTANEYIGDLGFSRLAGISLSSTQKYLDGLDEVLIYDRILTDLEVASITIPQTCTVTIPDANFKAYLVGNTSINVNGNSEIECSEAFAYSGQINCANLSISDMTGIEMFTSLDSLRCFNNLITTLDLSQNTALSFLSCSFNQLNSLNLANGNNTNVTAFNALSNPYLTCIQVDDATYSSTNWANIDAQTSFSENCPEIVLVSSITVQGQSGANTITIDDGTLQMEADVLPANASDAAYTWSVVNGTGAASIDVNGLLTALTNGTVDVVATANDGSGTTGMTTITISNQTVGINENQLVQFNIYPNPVQNELFIELNENQITQINIIDLSGKVLLSQQQINGNSINVSSLAQGVYTIQISTEKGITTSRFIKK